MKLFRESVSSSHSAQWLGSVRLIRPPSFAIVTSVAFAIAVVLIAFAHWGEINRKARLTGLLVPASGVLSVNAPQAGTVTELAVTEGQEVKAGQLLFVLNIDRQAFRNGATDDTGARIASQISARQASLSNERASRELQSRQRDALLSDRLRTLKAQLLQADEEVKLLNRRVQFSQATLNKYQQLSTDGFMSPAQVQVRSEELLDVETRLQSTLRGRLSIVGDIDALSAERDGLSAQLKTDISQLQRNLSGLEQEATENAARKTIAVSAPFAGRVSALGLQRGQPVATGQSILTLLRNDDANDPSNSALQAHLYAPSRTVGFAHEGQKVYLRYSAYPYQKFGLFEGEITSISETPFAPTELPPQPCAAASQSGWSN
jgi:membrane fusion protein